MVVAERSINQHILVKHLTGRFDQKARQEFKDRVDLAVDQGYRFIILNLTEVTFIDSAALGWLVLTQRRFQRLGGKLSIIACQGFVRDILDLTEISEWIPVFAKEDEALSALQAESTTR